MKTKINNENEQELQQPLDENELDQVAGGSINQQAADWWRTHQTANEQIANTPTGGSTSPTRDDM